VPLPATPAGGLQVDVAPPVWAQRLETRLDLVQRRLTMLGGLAGLEGQIISNNYLYAEAGLTCYTRTLIRELI